MAKVSRTKYLSNEGVQAEGTENNDRVYGGTGNDTIWGENGNDYLFGGLGNDKLYGGEDNDWLHGGNGDDTLDGDRGTNVLIGGFGNDTFVLNDFYIWGFGGVNAAVNTIADFATGVDRLEVKGHNKFSLGEMVQLDVAYFLTGSAVPTSGHEYYIYDQKTGKLYYDGDGNNEDAPILIATLLGNPDLKYTDIFTDFPV